MQTITKIIRPGLVRPYPGALRVPIFIKIEFRSNGELSLTGVIGPKSNGDAVGSCGQIAWGFEHRNPLHNDRRYPDPISPDMIGFADGWDSDLWLGLLDVWHTWHLNNTRA